VIWPNYVLADYVEIVFKS